VEPDGGLQLHGRERGLQPVQLRHAEAEHGDVCAQGGGVFDVCGVWGGVGVKVEGGVGGVIGMEVVLVCETDG